jgi:hypothetical protein
MVLGGGPNSPPCNLLRVDKITFGNGVMSSGHTTISRPDPALKRYKQRVHTMDQLMISFWRWAGSADDDINFRVVGGRKYSWKLHEVHDGKKLIVVPLKLDPSFHQDIIGKLSSRAFNWCYNNVGVPL